MSRYSRGGGIVVVAVVGAGAGSQPWCEQSKWVVVRLIAVSLTRGPERQATYERAAHTVSSFMVMLAGEMMTPRVTTNTSDVLDRD